jgi:hypothetical protein
MAMRGIHAMSTVTPLSNRPAQASVLDRVEAALRDLRYGAVELTVHDGRVVQIERREKQRLDSVAPDRC